MSASFNNGDIYQFAGVGSYQGNFWRVNGIGKDDPIKFGPLPNNSTPEDIQKTKFKIRRQAGEITLESVSNPGYFVYPIRPKGKPWLVGLKQGPTAGDPDFQFILGSVTGVPGQISLTPRKNPAWTTGCGFSYGIGMHMPGAFGYTEEGHWKGAFVPIQDATLTNTEDPAKAQEILTAIHQMKVTSLIDTSQGTAANPTVVKGGFVFCDFPDVVGNAAEIVDDFNDLTGTSGGNCILTDFITKESSGKVRLDLAMYASDSWVRLPKNVLQYADEKDAKGKVIKGHVGDLMKDVDAKIEIPDDWQILFLAFPKAAQAMSASQMCGNKQFDDNQNLNVVFMDPAVYKEKNNDTVWTTIHETMHALGLPDLYDINLNRSYGWSLMADCRTGWHLTGLEKLALGWHSLRDYYFLEDGTLDVELHQQQADDGLKKGIVIMPDANREDCYYIELAQPIGRTKSNMESFSRNGLLLMVAKLESRMGSISPFVAQRSNHDHPYGGAAKASFKPSKGEVCSTRGITINHISKIENGKVQCSVTVDAKYQAPDAATMLRENEFIAIPGDAATFGLAMSGAISEDCIVKYHGEVWNESDKYHHKDYGFCLYVDENGALNWVAGTGPDDTNKELLKAFSPPRTLPTGSYCFKLEKEEGSSNSKLSIYSENNGVPDTFQYTLFTLHHKDITRGWASPIDENGYGVALQSDGNLVVSQHGNFQWGANQAFNISPAYGLFEDNGTLVFYHEDGTVAKKFTGTPFLKGPYALRVKSDASGWRLVVTPDGTDYEYEITKSS